MVYSPGISADQGPFHDRSYDHVYGITECMQRFQLSGVLLFVHSKCFTQGKEMHCNVFGSDSQ